MEALVIISGERFSGKSTLCRRLIAVAEGMGAVVAGLRTELVDAHTLRVVEVHTGASYPLTRPWREGAGPLRDFVMDEAALARSDAALASAVPADLLVIDELGPMELVMGRGWRSALPLLRGGAYRVALVVVRPSLVAQALAALDRPITTTVWVTPENREALFALLSARLEGIIRGEGEADA